MPAPDRKLPTAAVVLSGNELLDGRTRDTNGRFGWTCEANPYAALALQICHRQFGHNPAVIDDGDAIADPLDLCEQMGVQEDRGTTIAQRSDDPANILAADGI